MLGHAASLGVSILIVWGIVIGGLSLAYMGINAGRRVLGLQPVWF
jgi:hypothetical protein